MNLAWNKMHRNKSFTRMVMEHLLVKMATSSQQSAITENEMMKFRGRVWLIVKIDRQLGFNRISVVDVDTGHQMATFGYELECYDELAAALQPDFETTAGAGAVGENRGPGVVDPNDTGQWVKMDDKAIDGLAKNRHFAHTGTQTKWAVGVFRGNITILTLIWECLGHQGSLFRCMKPGIYCQQIYSVHNDNDNENKFIAKVEQQLH